MKYLEGDVEDGNAARIADLEAELHATKQDLRKAQSFARDAQANAAAALAPLRRQLTPLYRALQAVFGELDAAGVEDTPSPSGLTNARDRSALGIVEAEDARATGRG